MSVQYEVIQTLYTSYGDDEIESYGSFNNVQTAIQLARQLKKVIVLQQEGWVISIRVVGWK